MKHAGVAAKIGDDKEDAAERIANTVKAADAVSADFGCNPKGWHEFSPSSASGS